MIIAICSGQFHMRVVRNLDFLKKEVGHDIIAWSHLWTNLSTQKINFSFLLGVLYEVPTSFIHSGIRYCICIHVSYSTSYD